MLSTETLQPSLFYRQHSESSRLSAIERDGVRIHCGDFLELSPGWECPIAIISDGPYGVAGFPGDPPTAHRLQDWYEPHIRQWSRMSSPQTTLWFWNSELGWANVHPTLERYGWIYRCCHIWDKGIGHIAGNSNSKSLRKFPVVTEVCVQYVKAAEFNSNGRPMSMQEWLRFEWERSGIPLCKANEACGVRNAATRKYLTKCHLWYFPPPEAFEQLASYANTHGRPSGHPYFSIDGEKPISKQEWSRMRAKFNCEIGVTNVWHLPAVRGTERLKKKYKCMHMNQKPLELIERIIRASTDEGDMVWEPFGGLCSGAIASLKLNRRCESSEIEPNFYEIAARRLQRV